MHLHPGAIFGLHLQVPDGAVPGRGPEQKRARLRRRRHLEQAPHRYERNAALAREFFWGGPAHNILKLETILLVSSLKIYLDITMRLISCLSAFGP